MDRHLRVVIVGAVESMQQIPVESRTWERVRAILKHNPLFEHRDKPHITTKKFLKEGLTFFKLDGEADIGVINEVRGFGFQFTTFLR